MSAAAPQLISTLVEKQVYRDGKIMHGLFDSNDNLVRGEIDYTLCETSSVAEFPILWAMPVPVSSPDDDNGGSVAVKVKCIKITDGYWNNGQLTKGRAIFKNGDIWEGEFNDGGLTNGKQICANGDVWEGEFCKNKLAKGKKICTTGNVLDGEWNNGQLTKGTVTKAKPTLGWEIGNDSNIFEVELKNNAQFTKGKITLTNGDVWDGEWGAVAGGRFTKGKKTFADGTVLEGEWEGAAYDAAGKEIMIDVNCDISIINYTMTRLKRGKRIFKDGRVWEGEWENGMFAKGKKTSKFGDVEDGEYNAFGSITKGKKTFASDCTVLEEEGEFVKGILTKGQRIFETDRHNPPVIKEEGEWNDEGTFMKGKRTLKCGESEEGEWNDEGKFMKGKKTWTDGDVWDGEYAYDKYENLKLTRGKITYGDGSGSKIIHAPLIARCLEWIISFIYD